MAPPGDHAAHLLQHAVALVAGGGDLCEQQGRVAVLLLERGEALADVGVDDGEGGRFLTAERLPQAAEVGAHVAARLLPAALQHARQGVHANLYAALQHARQGVHANLPAALQHARQGVHANLTLTRAAGRSI